MPKANDTDIYKFDLAISLTDYLFGTDSVDGKKNKSYKIKDIIQLINGVNGKNNLQYVYSDGTNPDISQYNTGYFFTDTLEADPLLFSQLILNKNSLQPIDLSTLFLKLDELQDVVIKLDNPVDPNNFFNFKIVSITNETDYFVFEVVPFKDFYSGLFLNETIYSLYFDIKSATDSDPLKLDKSTYAGNAQDLDTRIDALENTILPDAILKLGEVVVVGNTATIDANDFQWRLNQVDYLVTPAYSTTIANATAGYYRSDLIVGDNTGNYSLVQGVEDNLAAPEPLVPVGKIKLALIPVFGSTVGVPPLLPNYDDKFLKRYKSTYKTSKPIFNLMPSEDDYNVIFNGTTDSEIRIWENGYSGNFIKNGAIYPFKNMGTGIVSVWSNVGVTVNAPNGLILTHNQQCYLIKDDYNEWTLINPVSSFSGETAASIKAKYESNADTNAFTDTLKAKLDSITAIFTTALKATYDGVVTGYDALMLTGSRLITSGEITKLSNTIGTNTGDQDLSGLQPKGVRITNATTTGSYSIDWNAADVWQLTLTGAATIVDVNLPTGTATKVIELLVTGAFAWTPPAYWVELPSSQAYDGAKQNHVVVTCINGTTSSELVYYSNEPTT